jgi:hypothetical protein
MGASMVEEKLKTFLPFRLALNSLCVLATLATLSIGLASAARAACDPLLNQFQCGNICITGGIDQCCSNGSYCHFGACYYSRPGVISCCYRPQYLSGGRCVGQPG